jgi:hypothetical protein
VCQSINRGRDICCEITQNFCPVCRKKGICCRDMFHKIIQNKRFCGDCGGVYVYENVRILVVSVALF